MCICYKNIQEYCTVLNGIIGTMILQDHWSGVVELELWMKSLRMVLPPWNLRSTLVTLLMNQVGQGKHWLENYVIRKFSSFGSRALKMLFIFLLVCSTKILPFLPFFLSLPYWKYLRPPRLSDSYHWRKKEKHFLM